MTRIRCNFPTKVVKSEEVSPFEVFGDSLEGEDFTEISLFGCFPEETFETVFVVSFEPIVVSFRGNPMYTSEILGGELDFIS